MKRIPSMIVLVAALVAGIGVDATSPLGAKSAQGRLSFIRDAETENIIRIYATPLFKAAGLEPSAVNIYLVKDSTLNAFVAGGQKLFLNTGLIIAAEHAGQLIGVISHEVGHIAGGHLSRIHGALEKNTAQTILSYVLAGAATIATGRPDVGSAIVLGGQQVGLRSFLRYTRTQEAAADQAALSLLDRTGSSSRGFLEFLDVLSGQELLSLERQDPYLRTHPLTEERILAIKDHVSRSPYADTAVAPHLLALHKRMRAKLHAFLEPRAWTLRRYPLTDTSLAARYARAIAHYRVPDLEQALPAVDALIREHPGDPYFHELKGQMLFENGRTNEAMGPYETAVRLEPSSALLRRGLAQVQIETGDVALLDAAIANLRAALQRDRESPFDWRQLAIAHGRKGEVGESSLALAEEALLTGKKDIAKYQAGRAERLLPRGSRGWLQAQDVLQAAAAKD